MPEQQQPFPKKKKSKIWSAIKTIWKIFEKLVMVAIIFISLIIATQRLSNNDKAFLGYRIFRVQTGSMVPVYEVGDVILVKETEINKIKIGDDVTYWGTSGVMKGKLVTHRVIDVEEKDGEKFFYTQGVANTTKDPLVSAKQINGVVQGKLYIITAICTLLSNKYIFYFGAILPLTFFIFFVFMKERIKNFED